MNEDKLCFSLKMIKKHINYALGLSDDKNDITGYELLPILLEAAACNTYIETISNKADIFYLRCKVSLISMIEHAYQNYIKGISNKLKLNEKEVVLALIIPMKIFMERFRDLIFMAGLEKTQLQGISNFLPVV